MRKGSERFDVSDKSSRGVWEIRSFTWLCGVGTKMKRALSVCGNRNSWCLFTHISYASYTPSKSGLREASPNRINLNLCWTFGEWWSGRRRCMHGVLYITDGQSRTIQHSQIDIWSWCTPVSNTMHGILTNICMCLSFSLLLDVHMNPQICERADLHQSSTVL